MIERTNIDRLAELDRQVLRRAAQLSRARHGNTIRREDVRRAQNELGHVLRMSATRTAVKRPTGSMVRGAG